MKKTRLRRKPKTPPKQEIDPEKEAWAKYLSDD